MEVVWEGLAGRLVLSKSALTFDSRRRRFEPIVPVEDSEEEDE